MKFVKLFAKAFAIKIIYAHAFILAYLCGVGGFFAGQHDKITSSMQAEKERELFRRIEIISKYYDLEALLSDKTDQEAVAKYYCSSDFFYNLIHSKGGGNIHMGLSDDGQFHKSDFLKQAQFVGSHIGGSTKRVLEIGAGRVANSKYLAKQHPDISFTALDLPNRNFLKNKVPGNISLVEGDFNDLSVFPEDHFDIVFGVETVCHGSDKEHIIGEIARVLKPGGKLILFDVYEPKVHDKMTELEIRASAITLAAMRVTAEDQCIADMKRYLKKHQFSQIEITDLTEAIKPSLYRLERPSEFYFSHRRVLEILKKVLPYDATINGIAGWLMPLTFDGENIHQYNRVVATKRSDR